MSYTFGPVQGCNFFFNGSLWIKTIYNIIFAWFMKFKLPSPNLWLCFLKSAHRRTLSKWLCQLLSKNYSLYLKALESWVHKPWNCLPKYYIIQIPVCILIPSHIPIIRQQKTENQRRSFLIGRDIALFLIVLKIIQF